MARLNADNSSKRAVCYFWVVFAFFEIVILITSNFSKHWLNQHPRLLSLRPMNHNWRILNIPNVKTLWNFLMVCSPVMILNWNTQNSVWSCVTFPVWISLLKSTSFLFQKIKLQPRWVTNFRLSNKAGLQSRTYEPSQEGVASEWK